MAKSIYGMYLVLLALVDIMAFAVFLNGFFPVKSLIPGYAVHPNSTEPDMLEEPVRDEMEKIPRLYDRVILVLIDALRADFVLPESATDLPQMDHVRNLIQKNETISYIAKAHPPTVTMPRIKAMTTGGIPGFVDVVMNFNTQALQEDNLITQLHRHGLKMVFYGDDTWMRLYPGQFIRTDGTTSFFVTDYTEVDVNVTRHLADELVRHDWDVLILHYLGLDHIGHLAGPYSPLVKPKLQEMDNVINHILEALTREYSNSSSLLLLCGDHGMNDQGSHGGSSSAETTTPLIFIDPHWHGGKGMAYTRQTIHQIDIAPTMALALGVPIPQNSFGIVITDILRDLDQRDKLKAMYCNAMQLLRVLQQNIDNYEQELSYYQLQMAQKSHVTWIKAYISNPDSPILNQLAKKVMDQYLSAMLNIREKLSGMLLHYDVHAMGTAIITLVMVFFTMAHLLSAEYNSADFPLALGLFLSAIVAALVMFVHVSLCTSQMASNCLCSVHGCLVIIFLTLFLAVSTSVLVLHGIREEYRIFWLYLIKLYRADTYYQFLLFGTLGHTITLLSSSFVEEEHQTWYFLTVSLHILYAWKIYHIFCGTFPCFTETRKLTLHSTQDSEDDVDTLHKQMHSDVFSKRVQIPCMNKNKEGATNIYKDIVKNKTRLLIFSCICLILCRVSRAWNQTGDKWSHLPDVGDWLTCPENISILSQIAVIALISACIYVYKSASSLSNSILFMIGSAAVYCFRAANGTFCGISIYNAVSKGVLESRSVYTVAVIMTFIAFYKYSECLQLCQPNGTKGNNSASKNTSLVTDYCQNVPGQLHSNNTLILRSFRSFWADIQSTWLLLMLLLLRPHNIVLAAMVIWQEYIIRYITSKTVVLNSVEITLMYYWMGQSGFYYQGNSNSISTVDVSAGYTGLETYQPVIIGLLMAMSTYAFPIYWMISAVRLICDISVQNSWTVPRLKQALLRVLAVIIMCRALPLAAYTILATVQRYHLFVWTVFSPKLLYEGMHSTIVSVFVIAVATIQNCLPSA